MNVIVTRPLGGRVQYVAVRAPVGSTTQQLVARIEQGSAVSGAYPGPGADTTALEHGAELVPISDPPGGRPGGAPWLFVATGPDAGGAAPLLPGRWVVIGRDPRCDLPVRDPGLSRRHTRVRQERAGVRVEDLGSTNGTRWERAGGSDRWRPGDRLLVGGSGIVLLTRPLAPARTLPGAGTRVVTPWPRVRPSIEPEDYLTPGPPERRIVRPPSTWTWGLPLVIALAIALLLRMPWLLLFGLLGPTMVLGHHLGDRRAARLEHEEGLAAHTAQMQRNQELATERLQHELDERRRLDPGLVGVFASLVPQPSAALWQRLREPLVVTLGEHRCRSSIRHEGQLLTHETAPLVHPMDRPLVIIGPAPARDALARSLLLQLATGYPPPRWSLVVDPEHAPTAQWDLLAWLPHTVTDGTPPGYAITWGVDLLLLDAPEQAPPGSVRVLLGHGANNATLQVPGSPDVPFRPSTIALARARSMARTLAPLQCHTLLQQGDVGAATARPLANPATAPPEAPLGDLGPWPTTPAGVATTWRRPCLQVPLGLDPEGNTVVVDLARDGPHALVAGTTGSGKSELLRTLITALAIRCSPADLALLLVDFKGGSSLGDCSDFPQVTGLVTDLDPHLAQRVLTSLQAELTRRERALREVGAQDISGCPDLPRLVVVIDEFRVLAEEVPEVMSGLVRVAAVGRSLGVHLVLATQRPAGVVGADLRANVNLRIALRVRDGTDSFDVIETAEAATLPEGRPGLALWRTGADHPRAVQVARASPPSRDAEATWSLAFFDDVWAARRHLEVSPADPPAAHARDLSALSATLSQAAADLHLRAPVVWQPPLPARVMTDPDAPEVWAVADVPSAQCRQRLTWSMREHLALVGSAASGRSTALCSLLLRGRPAWTAVFDLGRSLGNTPVGDHPGVCAWVEAGDAAHGLRVLERTEQLILTRQARAGVGGASGAHDLDDSTDPPLIVVLDGWDRFVDEFGVVERGRGVEMALRILREGPAVGVLALVTGDRSVLIGRIAALLPHTWALRFNDPADLMLTGLRASQIPREQPPGRMIGVRDALEAQVVLPPEEPELARPAGEPPFRCRALPRCWSSSTGVPADSWAVGGDEATPVPRPAGSVLVLGPAGSGRSATLAALRGSRGGLLVEGSEPPEPAVLAARLTDLPVGDLLVVDDAHLLAGTPVEDLVLEHCAAHRRKVLIAADTDVAAAAFRGLVPHVARARCAVILAPASPAQGAIVGAQVPVGDVPVPGRGVLVHRGRCTRVQVVAPATTRACP